MTNANINSDTQAFTGLATHYSVYRPTYPSALFEKMVDFWGRSNSDPHIVDVGCGTGISTRCIFDFFHGKAKVLGVEPGTDMIAVAKKNSSAQIDFVIGAAESLPTFDKSVDFVTAAQAAQWFERPLFYKEAKRVLAKGGVLALFENNRNWSKNPLLDAHESFLETHSIDRELDIHYDRSYRSHPYEIELSTEFPSVTTWKHEWTRFMSIEQFYGMARSSTQFARAERNIGVETARSLLLEYARPFVDGSGSVAVNFVSKLYLGKFE